MLNVPHAGIDSTHRETLSDLLAIHGESFSSFGCCAVLIVNLISPSIATDRSPLRSEKENRLAQEMMTGDLPHRR